MLLSQFITLITTATAIAVPAAKAVVIPITPHVYNSSNPHAYGKRSDDSVVLPFINQVDRAYGIPEKKWDTQLVANAYKTVKDNNGQTEHHELNPGSLAQVLCPGRYMFNPSTGPYTPFSLVYLGWLCEVPGDPQLGGQCPEVLHYADLDDAGETGHHDILTSSHYTRIGCAFFENPDPNSDSLPIQGIWGCDLA